MGDKYRNVAIARQRKEGWSPDEFTYCLVKTDFDLA
jgi:hypothetical protein